MEKDNKIIELKTEKSITLKEGASLLELLGIRKEDVVQIVESSSGALTNHGNLFSHIDFLKQTKGAHRPQKVIPFPNTN